MPEAAVAADRNRPLARLARQAAGGGAAKAIAHHGVADIERRQDREQVAADIAAHMLRAEFALDQFHRRENRPLRTAGAE